MFRIRVSILQGSICWYILYKIPVGGSLEKVCNSQGWDFPGLNRILVSRNKSRRAFRWSGQETTGKLIVHSIYVWPM